MKPALEADGGRLSTAEPPDFVQSFARGLAVIEAFDREHAAMTLSEVARRAGLTRAAARRLLLTLCELGYAETDGRLFSLRPRVLKLGFAYLHAQGIWDLAQPFLVELVERIHESCSIAVLDGRDIVYVARVPTRTRIMSINLGIGSRLPAHATSLGRVLLAALSEPGLDAVLTEASPLPAYTERTVTDPAELARRIAQVRRDGWCILDQELELGLRSIAVPLRGPGGKVVAALNAGLQASRFTLEAMRQQVLPEMLRAAAQISTALGAPTTAPAAPAPAARRAPPPAAATRRAAAARARPPRR
ncbi:IclR family transcriptional regulator domain-containing protein [Zeimonas arvi]|uniref:Helix-turn-helix domain-containing protein n=1 Tax=Zeimonas arvi TaxID=2498847 RepID=A0A5C8NW83_9BURK|nr:helix-turn-helix domain-containing protein [Zeimonas arvi]